MNQTKNHKFEKIKFSNKSYSMLMEKLEYRSLLRQLNEEK
jgi:hypothetical protein